MTKEEKLFIATGEKMKGVEQSQMFGKPCFKLKGKAFACFFENEMVFKQSGDVHEEVLLLKGAKLFDPSGKKRPMKEWVQVSAKHSALLADFAKASMKYLSDYS